MTVFYHLAVAACTLVGMTFLLLSGEWGFAALLFMAGAAFSTDRDTRNTP